MQNYINVLKKAQLTMPFSILSWYLTSVPISIDNDFKA